MKTLRTRLSDEGEPAVAAPKEEPLPSKPIVPGSPVQRPQSGNYSRILPGDATPEQDGFMSFFEKKNDEQ
jgi:hypothetical protein